MQQLVGRAPVFGRAFVDPRLVLSTGAPRIVSIYGRSGFRVAEGLDAPGAGPHIWFMSCDP